MTEQGTSGICLPTWTIILLAESIWCKYFWNSGVHWRLATVRGSLDGKIMVGFRSGRAGRYHPWLPVPGRQLLMCYWNCLHAALGANVGKRTLSSKHRGPVLWLLVLLLIAEWSAAVVAESLPIVSLSANWRHLGNLKGWYPSPFIVLFSLFRSQILKARTFRSNCFCIFNFIFFGYTLWHVGFPGSSVKNLPANEGAAGDRFYPWARKIPWRRTWHPTPVFLLG